MGGIRGLIEREGGRALRYLGVGVILLAVDYGSFSLLLALGAPLELAQAVARALGALAGFLLQKLVVFRDRERKSTGIARQGLAYGLLTVTNILLSGLLVGFFAGRAGLEPFSAKILTDILMAGLAYLLLHAIFRETESA